MGKFSDILEKSGVGEWRAPGEERRASGKASAEMPEEQRGERFRRTGNVSWPAAESLRLLCAKILDPDDGECFRTIMVTSAAPAEGKSFVSANLGVAIAQSAGQYALLVDCDLRQPSLAKLFGMSAGVKEGLADYLADDRYQVQDLLLETSIDRLSILPSGKPPDSPAELLASARMRGLADELSNRYDDRLIIFDSPPFQAASATAALAKQVDGVVLVVGYGKSARKRVRTVVEAIGPERIVGLVFNGMRGNFPQRPRFGAHG